MRWLLAVLALAGASVNASSLEVGLLARYTFNGDSNDQSGNNRNSTTVNTDFVSDRFGNSSSAVRFNGVSSYVYASSVLTTNVQSAFTISMWFRPFLLSSRPISPPSDFNYILFESIDSLGNNPTSPYLFSNGFDNKLIFGGSSFSGGTTSPNFYQQDTWNHLIVTGDLATQKLSMFLFGINSLVASAEFSYTSWGSEFFSNIILGADRLLRDPNASSAFDTFFYGEMDDVRIYERALSSTEATNLNSLESVPEPSSLSLLLAGGAVLMSCRRKS